MKKKPTIHAGRRGALASFALSCLFPAIAYAQTTGWNKTDAGPYDYNDTANWVNGTINGIWDPSLTLTAAQTATFGEDTSASTGLGFRYDGGQNLTLRSAGTANRLLTLGGNIIVDTVSANRTITIGSTTANQGLNVNLGGTTRTLSVGGIANSSSIRTLTFANNVTNGGLILNGGGIVNLNGNTNTLSSLRIRNNAFRITGNSGANTSTSISGALTIDGIPSSVASNTDNLGGIATITLTPNASRNTTLSASSLVRENKGVAFFRGNSLGGTLGANGVANITFTTAPDLIGGGGGAGSTNIGILPWAVGATTATTSANTFVTYDSVNGIRPLNTATEFVTYNDSYSGAVSGTDNNIRIAASSTVNFAGNNTVNSLFVGESGSTSTLTGDGTLTVTSGAVFLQGTNSTISLNLNFGTREGIIGHTQGQNTTFSGTVAGSGGITVYQAQPNTSTSSAGSGTTLTGSATYTGDFTVLSRASVAHSDFLAHGSRSGNVVVNGLLTLNGLGTDSRGYTMNGLYGGGRLSKGFSGTGLFRIGDNNSNGVFTGVITDGGTTALEKIGGGTQIFTGANSWAGVTRVLGGTLDVSLLADGLQNSGIGRSSNAATNLVLNGGTLKYSGVATSTDRLFTVGTSGGGLDSSGSGAVTLNNAGNNITAEAANRNGTRVAGSNIVTGVTNFADLKVGARIHSGTGIPSGTTIVSLNPTAGEITLSAESTANVTNGNMSFSTDRTFTLGGTNTGNNIISGGLGNSVNSGKLSVVKSGTGKWILAGATTYAGDTEVLGGTLVLSQGNFANESSTLRISSSATLVLDFSGTQTVDRLFINGVQQSAGVYKPVGSSETGTPIAQLSGDGTLTVVSDPAPGGDGYADWAATNAGGQDADEDFDSDGVPNGIEYFMNAPAGFTASPGITGGAVSWTNGGNIASSAYGTEFVVQTSPDLVVWTDVEESDEDLDNQAGSVSYTLPTGAGKLFVRLAVNPQ